MGYHHRLSGFICRAQNQPPSYQEDMANHMGHHLKTSAASSWMVPWCLTTSSWTVWNITIIRSWSRLIIKFNIYIGLRINIKSSALLNIDTSLSHGCVPYAFAHCQACFDGFCSHYKISSRSPLPCKSKQAWQWARQRGTGIGYPTQCYAPSGGCTDHKSL